MDKIHARDAREAAAIGLAGRITVVLGLVGGGDVRRHGVAG